MAFSAASFSRRARRASLADLVLRPCRQFAAEILAFPSAVLGPVLRPPCNLHFFRVPVWGFRSFARRQGVPPRVVAPHRGAVDGSPWRPRKMPRFGLTGTGFMKLSAPIRFVPLDPVPAGTKRSPLNIQPGGANGTYARAIAPYLDLRLAAETPQYVSFEIPHAARLSASVPKRWMTRRAQETRTRHSFS
jgi:hypothetical protein